MARPEYLRTHARNQLVANADWGDYYFLYYLNPASRYVVGIEPTMMYLSGADKYGCGVTSPTTIRSRVLTNTARPATVRTLRRR